MASVPAKRPVEMSTAKRPRRDGEAQHQGAEPDAKGDARRLRNGLIWTGVLVVLFGGIALAVPDLRGVLDRASNANFAWLAVGVVLELASCLGYVAIMRLVLPGAPERDARRLGWAEMAFGAVVPVGGAGSLAVGAWAMRAWGVAWSRIANRSAVIFLLTSGINVIVLGLAGVGMMGGLGSSHKWFVYGLVPAAIAAGTLALFVSLPRVPGVRRTSLAQWVRDTEAVTFEPNWRLLGALGYLLFDIAVLYVSLRAVGVHAPVFALVLGYQIGYLANIVPIPGGIGALEGGLLAALVLYGLPAAPTAAAVVLYHAIALWVPTLGGTYGFARLRHSITARRPRLASAASSAETAAPEDLAA